MNNRRKIILISPFLKQTNNRINHYIRTSDLIMGRISSTSYLYTNHSLREKIQVVEYNLKKRPILRNYWIHS